MCIFCMAITTPHTISIIRLSPPNSCSHWCEPFSLFDFLSHHYSLRHPKCHLSCLCSFIAWVAQSQKRDDRIVLYLTDVPGMSHNKIPKRPCVKVSRLSSQQLFSIFKLSTFLTLHGITIWRHSIHGQRELFYLYVLALLVSILDIDSCLILLCLRLYVLIVVLNVLLVLVACHQIFYLGYHLPTWGRAGIKLGDADTSQTYL